MKKLSYVKLHETCLYFPFPFSSSVLQSFFLFPASSLFGTQQQLTHPPVKSSTLPVREMAVFQGVAPWHKIFTSSCVIPLWDSATAHSHSGKELNPSSQEDSRFSGRCTLTYNFYFILRHPSSGLKNSSLTLRQRAQPFLSGICPFFRVLQLGIKFSLHPASSHFGTQQQLTHPPVKS